MFIFAQKSIKTCSITCFSKWCACTIFWPSEISWCVDKCITEGWWWYSETSEITQCFLSRFWVSKWHPNFWKSRYGFALYWSKTIWDKHVFLHVAIATDGCNVIGPHNFLAPKLQAKIVRLVSVHRHAHRFGLSYYTAADLYSMVYETAKAL